MRTARRILSFIALPVAIGFLAWALRDTGPELRAALARIDAVSLALAALASVAMLLFKARYHIDVCERITGRRGLAARIVPAYFVAQVVRYLPGKIWGVVYQADRLAHDLGGGAVIATNVYQMIATNLASLGVIAAVLGAAWSGASWPLLGIPLTLLAIEGLHRSRVTETALFARLARIGAGELPSAGSSPPRLAGRGTLWLTLDWLAYLAVFLVLAPAGFGLTDSLLVACLYAGASLLAILAVAVPAGLAVREALFLSLGSGAGADLVELASLALLVRLVFTLAELICVPLARAWAERVAGPAHG